MLSVVFGNGFVVGEVKERKFGGEVEGLVVVGYGSGGGGGGGR